MTKTQKVKPFPRYHGKTYKVEETVLVNQPKSIPVNLAEEKERFFRFGKTPKFEVQDPATLSELAGKTKNKIRFDLQGEAVYILERIRDEYGDGERFLEHAFGPRIEKEEATPMLLEYIAENSLSESLTIHWCDNLACSAKMMWRGPMLNCNRPELRKYSLWINGSDENNYMRESGIRCLMDHEIGTHFFRMLNDGFQPWFSNRAKFGLRNMGSFEGQCTEEGLASINTVLRGRVKLLWGAALAYYTACKAAELSFKQLFDHIGRYTSNPDYRWKQVMRVKRGLADPNDLGGFGNDQCYFEGAVTILRNMENIDFSLLMCGKVCYDELDRIKRVARKDCLRFPTFMQNMKAYMRTLRRMAIQNGLDKTFPAQNPPAAYLKRLDERKRTENSLSSEGKKSKKVRPKAKVGIARDKQGKSTRKFLKRKGKDIQKNEGDEEVKSFEVSSRFVNVQQQQEEEARRKEEVQNTYRLVETVTCSLTTMDSALEKRIKELQDIVEGHSWSNKDNSYKESLLNQASSELPNGNLFTTFGEDLLSWSAVDKVDSTGHGDGDAQPKSSLHRQRSQCSGSSCLQGLEEKEMRDSALRYSLASTDSGHKEDSFSQASCQLTCDSQLTFDETLRTGSSLDKTECTEHYDRYMRPKTSLNRHKTKNAVSYRLPALDKNSHPPENLNLLKKNNLNSNNSLAQLKQLKSLSSLSEQDDSSSIDMHMSKGKTKAMEVVCPGIIQEKMKHMKNKFYSLVNPEEIIFCDDDVCQSVSEVDSLMSSEMSSAHTPAFSSKGATPSLSSVDNNGFGEIFTSTCVSNMVVSDNSSTAEVSQATLNKKSGSLETQQNQHMPCSASRDKLLNRRGSLSLNMINSNEKLKAEFFFDEVLGTGDHPERMEDTPTPIPPKKKKSPWDGIVSRYAQRKPVEAPKLKLDREILRADLCQPVSIQAERLLQAEKILHRARSHHHHKYKSFPSNPHL